MKKVKVLVGMSGGVDSSVSAYLLKEQGYDVVGVTMNLWTPDNPNNVQSDRSCCSIEAFNDARAVCTQLGIPYYVLNFQEIFKKHVVDNFISEYLKGRTPNPCVLCNTIIKWDELLKKADELGCKYLATGHYGKIRFNKETELYELRRGDDPKKDQSYFLYGMTQRSLSRTLFPLSQISKDKVREIAKNMDLKTAEKKESMEICFIPDDNYNRFLKDNVEDIGKIIKPGTMQVKNGGKLIRKHNGYPFYTIGQRKGLGGGFTEPMYVSNINPDNNIIEISARDGVFRSELIIENMNWIGNESTAKIKCTAKIRFNSVDTTCIAYPLENNKVKVIFNKPVFAVTPGQSAVLYDGDIVLGGGLIV
ncbi:MAG: tRNA 2-thiouridine(34) synthase MnmA [Candidatus Delongbacteria bacterium]|nr:tRNA 2-thiouridine(34) synthase MnmA [Candidatus Delongbacteria bacterium]